MPAPPETALTRLPHAMSRMETPTGQFLSVELRAEVPVGRAIAAEVLTAAVLGKPHRYRDTFAFDR